MDAWLLGVSKKQISRQCRFALLGYDDLDRTIADMDAHRCEIGAGMTRIWYSIQGILVAAGNISKLLWPAKSQIPERGSELRKSLSVEEDSPLKARDFRNHFEHFDERLEEFFIEIPADNRSYIDDNVSPGRIAGLKSGTPQRLVLRHYDQRDQILMFRDEAYHLRPLREAIRDLLNRAEETDR
jgi:hypothetical protein